MECLKIFVKLLACGILILQCCKSSLAAEITLKSSIKCPHNSQGAPAAYRPDMCTLTIDVTGISTDTVTKLPLEVKVEIPVDSSSRQSCKTLYNGTKVACQPNVMYRYVKAIVNPGNIDDIKVTGTLGTDSSPFDGTEPFNVTSLVSNSQTQSPYELLFNFSSFNGGTDTVKLELKIAFPIARPDVGEKIPFKTVATYGTTTPVDASSKLELIGTQLRFKTFESDPPGALEAGSSVKVTVLVEHTSGSTIDAKATTVTLASLPTGYDCSTSDVTFPSGTKTATPVTSLLSGLTIGDVVKASAQTFTIEMSCQLTVNVLIQESAAIGITVSYTGDKYPSKPHSLYDSIAIPTKSIEITTNTCEFPSTFHVGEEVKCETVFKMPLGTMAFQGHCIEATVGPSNESPVEGKSSIITPNSVIQYNPSSVGGGFTTGNNRRKRAVSPTYTFYIKKNYGIFTNPTAGGVSGATVTLKTTFVATKPSGAVSGTLYPFLEVNNNKAYLNMFGVTITRPNLQIAKSVSLGDATANPQRVKFEVDVKHASSSTASASNVVINDDVRNFDTYTSSGITPSVGTPGFKILADTIQYQKGSLGLGQSLAMKYVAGPKGTGKTYLPEGDTTKEVLLSYEMQYTDTSGNPQTVKFVDSASVCLTRNETVVTSTANLYGLAILSGFFGLLAGALIALVIWILVICVCKKGMKKSEVQPASEAEMKNLKSKMRTVMTDHKEAMKKTGNLIKDYSLIGVDESIVFILMMKDKLGIHRELDNLDILSTIHIDQNLDNERDLASVEASKLTVKSLSQNGDVAPEVEAKSLGLFMKNLGDLDKKIEVDYRKELKEILKRLANKNKAKLAELLGLQSQERQKTAESIRDLPEENQKELMDLLHQKHQTEQNELAYRLKLEQDEETENLRKEFAIRRRMGIKDSQQHFLDDIARNGDLRPEQVDWLMKEHAKNQAKLETLYDEEISRQRMVLEEKLARRKQLATETEMQEEEHSALLNTMAGQQLGIIKNMKKEGVITKAEMDEMIRKLKEDMLKLKQKLEEDRKKQEEKLHKELSARKKAKMEAKQKEIDAQLAALETKQHKSAQAGDKPVDPMSFFESRMTMLSLHRGELNDLENAIDREHATELKKLREGFTDATKDELAANKEKLVEKLKEEGMTDAQLNRLLRQHEKELQQLLAAQEEERTIQHDSFKRRLAKNRKNWDKRKLEEKQEQEQLRAHEGNVVRNIIDNQMSMSDAERERILKEHEKQMVKLENSLTLNKLRQKRMLEDKLAKKRIAQMERLEKKQMSETKKMKRRLAEEETEDEDALEDKKQREQINMLKKHAEQKIAILHGDKLKLEDELEEIRTEMMQERALALKEQEERLAAMLASLQLEKAKEMAKIEEQQKAINSLKSNLMDDLTDKGVLSSPECQKVIEIHQKEKEKLNKKLDAQKQKQEKVLRQRLAERMEQKEQALKDIHEKELKEVIGNTKSKAASKIKRVSIMHKHMLEMEKFKNRMDKEMNQTLEDVRRQHELRKAEAVNAQELQFIAGLVRLGCFQKEELLDVLRMLFPLRQEAEIAEVFTQIYDEEAIKNTQRQPSKGGHSLADRIRVATSATFDESLPALGRRRKVKKTDSRSSLRDQLLGKSRGNQGSVSGGFNEKPRLGHRPSKGFISDALAEPDEKPRFSRGGSLAEMPRPSLMESKPHFSRDTLSNRPKYSIAESVIDREMDSLALDSHERPEQIGHNSPEHYELYNTDKEALLGSRQSRRGLPPLRASPRMRNNEFR